MSEISSRPRVHSVSSAVLRSNANVSAGAAGAAVAGAALTVAVGGAILAAGVIALMVRGLSSAAKAAYRKCVDSQQVGTSAELIQPISAVRKNHRRYQQQVTQTLARHSLSQTEAIQVSTLLTVAATPYFIEDSAAIEQPLEALRLSASPDAAISAGQQLVHTLEESHHKVFVQALTLACTNATLKVGFDFIDTQTGPTGVVRVIASDASGRSLVTEISAQPHHDPRIETEVVGVSDGSCRAILDAFDKALEEEGVRAAVPTRKPTGGVCELAAAREFVRKKVKRTLATPQGQTIAEKTDSAMRRQNLNLKKDLQKQK